MTSVLPIEPVLVEPAPVSVRSPSPLAIEALVDEVEMRDRSVVMTYLSRNPSLLPVINEATTRIRQLFGYDAPLVLEVEPEPEDGSEELFLLIQTRKAPVDARGFLAQLDQSWWLSVVPQVGNLLNIDVEYV